MNSLEIFFIVICIGLSYLVLEIYVRSLVLSTRKKFQWLITKDDELPEFSEEGLKKFLIHGYDSELGWVRKPNTEQLNFHRHQAIHYLTTGTSTSLRPIPTCIWYHTPLY